MIPAVNTSHVYEAKKRLLTQFQGKPRIEGFLKAFVKRVQRLEDEAWKVLGEIHLNTNNTYILNCLGTILQLDRGPRTNAQYRAALALRILVLRSKGRASDLIKILVAATGGNNWGYWTTPPAGFVTFHVGTSDSLSALTDSLRAAKAGGVDGRIYFSPDAFTKLLIPATTTAAPLHYDVVSPFENLEPTAPNNVGDVSGFFPVHCVAL